MIYGIFRDELADAFVQKSKLVPEFLLNLRDFLSSFSFLHFLMYFTFISLISSVAHEQFSLQILES